MTKQAMLGGFAEWRVRPCFIRRPLRKQVPITYSHNGKEGIEVSIVANLRKLFL